ncbi:MAG: hypothetical protein N4A46_09510, partial [Schleiferiaceae bacterium]|nr:hypothetical protein [Schleiferiaceae bacterium]
MKPLLLTLFLTLSRIVLAAHGGVGAEVSMEKINGNVYEITAVLYHIDYYMHTLTIKTDHPTTPTVVLSRTDLDTLPLSNCFYDPSLYLGVYKGQAYLPNMPATGVHMSINSATSSFYWYNTNNLPDPTPTLFEFAIFPNFGTASPRFNALNDLRYETDTTITINMGAYNSNRDDSLHFSFASLKVPSSQFNYGYSQQYPFGDTVTTFIDPQTGIITAENVPPGLYYLGVQVDAYRNGHKSSYIRRELNVCIGPNGKLSPDLKIDNIKFTGQDSSQVNGNYHFE